MSPTTGDTGRAELSVAGSGKSPTLGWIFADGPHPLSVDQAAVGQRLAVTWPGGSHHETSTSCPPLQEPADFHALCTMREDEDEDGALVVIGVDAVATVEWLWPGGSVSRVATSRSPWTGRAFAVSPVPSDTFLVAFRLLDQGGALLAEGSLQLRQPRDGGPR